jgi:putative ABC transport system permease protein
MLKSYIKISFRHLLKNKSFSFINITGLSLGIATTILILLWVQTQLDYDGFFKHADSIYRVTGKVVAEGKSVKFPYVPFPLAETMIADIPEIEDAAVFSMYSPMTVNFGDKVFKESSIAGAGASFFRILSFPFIAGNPQRCLSEPYSVVITESTAMKYFGNKEPLNKSILINGIVHKITGVMNNIPRQCHLQFDLITSSNLLMDQNSHNWGSLNFPCYAKLKSNVNKEDVDRKILKIMQSKIPGILSNLKLQTELQPLISIHQSGEYTYDYAVVLDGKYVVIFSIVALFILGIAIINFINMSTATASARLKEVGLRKVVGSTKVQLIWQFFVENIFILFVAFALAIVIVELVLPVFNRITGEKISVNFVNPALLLKLIGIFLISGLFAGSYPAIFLSSFSPVSIFKKNFYSGSNSAFFRKAFVLFQFAISICLIVSAIIVVMQLNYIENKNLGFDKENVVYIPLNGIDLTKYESLKNELIQNPGISNVTAANYLLTDLPNRTLTLDCNWEGKDPNLSIPVEKPKVYYDYFKTLGYKLIEGRTFSPDFPTDVNQAFVVNEEMIKLLEIKDPVGKQFTLQGKTGTIIGVVENVNSRSLQYKIESQIFSLFHEFKDTDRGVILLKIKAGNIRDIRGILGDIQTKINKINSGHLFEYHFLDQAIQNQYSQMESISEILYYFTFLAIFIACLGLFGLISFQIRSRVKEIGIRKVLGSSVTGIVFMICKEFGWSVFLANIIAWPVAYYFMNNWLQDFAYRIEMSWWMFALAGGFALLIALATVSFQAIRAATANPVESLRYE